LGLAIAFLFGYCVPPARASDRERELDRRIAEALADVPVERAGEAIRFLLETQLGSSGVLAVSPGSLWDHDSATEEQAFPVSDGFFHSDGGFGGCGYVPIRLRGDATITGLAMLFIDNDADNFDIELRRKNTGNLAPAEVLAHVASTGANTSHRIVVDLTVANGVIDYANYAYFLWVCRPYFGSELHGIYLTYTY
jgi:hypothetical protein